MNKELDGERPNRYYGDALARYRHDGTFHALVDMIFNAALSNGFTPGELRDASFVAGVKLDYMHGVEAIRVSGYVKDK